MATFIMFFRFTEQGIRNIVDSPARVEAARQTVEKYGGTVQSFYALTGEYDTMFIVRATDDEAASRAALAISAAGNVRTTTVRAYGEEEFAKLAASLRA